MTGILGNIRVNKNGDMVASVAAYQYQRRYVNGIKSYVTVKVGTLNSDNMLSLDMNRILWIGYNNVTNSSAAVKPDSVCSLPCKSGQYTVQLDSACCWICEPCPPDGDVSWLCSVVHYLLTSCSRMY